MNIEEQDENIINSKPVEEKDPKIQEKNLLNKKRLRYSKGVNP
jgi:hypothetical protein